MERQFPPRQAVRDRASRSRRQALVGERFGGVGDPVTVSRSGEKFIGEGVFTTTA
jgi:hypothetical protein